MKYAQQLKSGKFWKSTVFLTAVLIPCFCTAEMSSLYDILKPLSEEKTPANHPDSKTDAKKTPAESPRTKSEFEEIERAADAALRSIQDVSNNNLKNGIKGEISGIDRITDDILSQAAASSEEDDNRSFLEKTPEFRTATEEILRGKENASRRAEDSILDRAAVRIMKSSFHTEFDGDEDDDEEDWEEDEFFLDDENSAKLTFLPFALLRFNTKDEMIFAQNQEQKMLLIIWEEIPAISSFSSLLNEYFTPLMTSYLSGDSSGTSILLRLYQINQILLPHSPPTSEYSTFIISSSDAAPPSFSSGGSGSSINAELLKQNILPISLLGGVFLLILYISYKQFML